MTVRRLVIIMMGSVVLAGCGGDDDDRPPLSAAAFRERANAICGDLQRANDAAAAKAGADDEAALARVAREAGERMRAALERLDDLEGPEREEAELDRFLDRADAFGEAVERQSEALRKGDADASRRALDEIDRLNAETRQAARDAGLDACAA